MTLGSLSTATAIRSADRPDYYPRPGPSALDGASRRPGEGIIIPDILLSFLQLGAQLDNNVMKESETYSVIECAHLCLSDYPLCKSINYETNNEICPSSRHKCQLNNATKSLQPENLVKDEGFNYFEMIQVIRFSYY